MKQAALLGPHGLSELAGEPAHQLFLPLRELPGHLDLELQHVIASAVAPDARDALAAAHDDLVGLDPGLELDRRRAVAVVLERVDLDLASERGLDAADRHLGEHILAVALDPLVALDMEHDVKVAGGAT